MTYLFLLALPLAFIAIRFADYYAYKRAIKRYSNDPRRLTELEWQLLMFFDSFSIDMSNIMIYFIEDSTLIRTDSVVHKSLTNRWLIIVRISEFKPNNIPLYVVHMVKMLSFTTLYHSIIYELFLLSIPFAYIVSASIFADIMIPITFLIQTVIYFEFLTMVGVRISNSKYREIMKKIRLEEVNNFEKYTRGYSRA